MVELMIPQSKILFCLSLANYPGWSYRAYDMKLEANVVVKNNKPCLEISRSSLLLSGLETLQSEVYLLDE